jgi:hypothetical protein
MQKQTHINLSFLINDFNFLCHDLTDKNLEIALESRFNKLVLRSAFVFSIFFFLLLLI